MKSEFTLEMIYMIKVFWDEEWRTKNEDFFVKNEKCI